MSRQRNQAQTLTITLLLPILLALVSIGCGLTSRIANLRGDGSEFAPTRTPMPTFTPTPAGASFIDVPVVVDEEPAAEPISDVGETQPQPAAEAQAPAEDQGASPDVVEVSDVEAEAPPAEPTPTPEPTPEPTPDTVTVTVLQDMNVRGGPGTNYPVVGSGPAGATSTVVGRNSDSSWVQVQYPPDSSSTGWLYAELVEVQGDPSTAPVVNVDPPPQPVAAAPAPQPEEEAPPPAPPEKQYQFTPTGWFASENAAIVHFKGRIRDEAGNLVNGYSVRLDNWTISIISHPTGASGWYPEKGDGEWDVSGIPLAAGQGWWWLSVVRYECDFWAGFDSQCENFTTLSEEVKIEVRTPEESVINADWVCHWDCDKGLYTEGYRRE